MTTKFNAAGDERDHKQRAAPHPPETAPLRLTRQSVTGRGGGLASDEKALGAHYRSYLGGGEFIERIYKMVSAMSSATIIERASRRSPSDRRF